MAQEISTIQSNMLNSLVTQLAVQGRVLALNKLSGYDYRQLLTYAEAAAVGTMEQFMDAFKADVEALVDAAAPQTPPWWQSKMFGFQYSETNPQIIQIQTDPAEVNYLNYYYADPDATLQIVKYCTVTPGTLGTVNIKCAAQEAGLPVSLTSDQISAAQSYVEQLNNTGIYISILSTDADLLYIAATIYFKGQYSAIIQSSVISAINAYMAGIPFDGKVTLLGLQIAIKNVAGVNDVVLNNVQARPYNIAYGSGTNLVLANTELQSTWSTIAGYIIPETDGGHTLADSLTFVAQ